MPGAEHEQVIKLAATERRLVLTEDKDFGQLVFGAEQVLRLFSHAERHLLSRAGRVVQSFEAEFTPLQRQVLDLLGVPASGLRG